MKSKPNPFFHMMAWGCFSGAILTLIFSVLIFLFLYISNNMGFLTRIPDIGLLGSIIMGSLAYGGIPGLILGFIDGLILWLIMLGRPLLFGREDMQAAHLSVYALLGTLTLVGGYLLIMIVFRVSFFQIISNIFFFVPPIIAALASVYAGHHYLLRLVLWSEQAYGARKEKAKNEALGRL